MENIPLTSLLKTLFSASNDDDDDDGQEEAVVDHVDGHRYDEPEGVDTKVCRTLTLRSSLRKVDSNSTEADKVKKKVQWVDVAGIKELAEVREFEPRLVVFCLVFFLMESDSPLFL